MALITVQFYKYPASLHWGIETSWLGDDDWGVWLSFPRGSARWKGPVTHRPNSVDAVVCVPHDDWWLMHFSPDHEEFTHFIDIATPPRWSDGRVELIDLDLDILVSRDGTVAVDDEDEFLLHQVELGYPADMVRSARDTADRVFGEVAAGADPFFEVANSWYERV